MYMFRRSACKILALSWSTFIFWTWYSVMSTCTGGDESLFDLYPTSATYTLPLSLEAFSPASRGETLGRASSSKHFVSSGHFIS